MEKTLPLLCFIATTAFFPQLSCLYPSPPIDSVVTNKSALRELCCPTAFTDQRCLLPHFPLPKKASIEPWPGSRKSPPTGFGYPLGDSYTFNPWQPLSATNTLGLRPSKLSSSPEAKETSRSLLSALALSHKTHRPYAGASASSSSEKAVSLFASQLVTSGRDLLLSWALRTSQGFSSS